jgi:YcaO-like protein with predicted kinase domain
MEPFTINQERTKVRLELARRLWTLPYSELLKYGISSFRDVTNVDVIGIPVWMAYRPPGKTISVTAGKSLDPLMAFAGCITEAIEIWAAENPTGAYLLRTYEQIKKEVPDWPLAELLPLLQYPLSRDNVVNESTPICWEQVHAIRPGSEENYAWMPSNAIWMTERMPAQFEDFPRNSNGLAAGTSLQDAVLQGIYEIVERDGWSIERFIRERTGRLPRKIEFSMDLPPDLELCRTKINQAGVYPLLFDCSSDLGIPVVGCALLDPTEIGTFGGFGCSLSPHVAAMRAITEAAQSRLSWINGARDDLFRRDFILAKQTQTREWIRQLDGLKAAYTWRDYCNVPDATWDSTRDELEWLTPILEKAGIRLYYKQLAELDINGSQLVVAKAIAPQLEGAWTENWVSNGRAVKHLKEVAT